MGLQFVVTWHLRLGSQIDVELDQLDRSVAGQLPDDCVAGNEHADSDEQPVVRSIGQ